MGDEEDYGDESLFDEHPYNRILAKHLHVRYPPVLVPDASRSWLCEVKVWEMRLIQNQQAGGLHAVDFYAASLDPPTTDQ